MSEQHKHQFVIAAIIATTVPFLFIVNMPASWSLASDNLRAIALYLSSVAGYVSLSLIVWEFILGTRSVSGLYFADLASKLRLHRWLGTYGVAAFVLHVVLVIVAYNESLLYGIMPSLDTPYETAVTYGRLAFMGIVAIWLTSAIARKAIAFRPWKYIHYLAYPIMFLSLLHIPPIGSSFANRAVLFYWTLFVITILLCTALRMRHLFGYGKLVYDIEQNRAIGDGVYLLQLRAQGKSLTLKPEQYVYLQPGLRHEEHPFTVLDFDEQGRIIIAFKVYGSFTKKLAQMEHGSTLLVDGPYGNFMREHSDSLQPGSVFIAGGIGVTPFLWHAMHRRDDQHYLLYANRTHESAVLRSNLKSALGDRYIDILSREQDRRVSPNVEHGHVSADIIRKYISDPHNRDYYICGPDGLIQTAREQLRSIGVPGHRIHTEEFSF